MDDSLLKQQEPYANEKDLTPFLNCVDHTVSRETFTLLLDSKTDLLVTSPRPALDKLSSYYESEEYISHTDSSRSMMDKVYQMIKNYSVKEKLRMINKLSNTKGRILDIGCGTGDLLAACESNGWKINGVEFGFVEIEASTKGPSESNPLTKFPVPKSAYSRSFIFPSNQLIISSLYSFRC